MTRLCHLVCDSCRVRFPDPVTLHPGYEREDHLVRDAKADGWDITATGHVCSACPPTVVVVAPPVVPLPSMRLAHVRHNDFFEPEFVEHAPVLDWGAE